MKARLSILLITVFAVGSLLMVNAVPAAADWGDEILNAVSFYQTTYPNSNWDPYVKQATKVRDAIDRKDEKIVKAEMNQFLKMLTHRAHGINGVASDDLYNFSLSAALTMKPYDAENTSPAVASGAEFGSKPMSVPQNEIQTPYQDGPPCKPGGCDYWLDDVFDAGAQ
ncbi:MAG: hypothetical protein ACREJU_12335 [Nitrospiraceae bacterium]